MKAKLYIRLRNENSLQQLANRIHASEQSYALMLGGGSPSETYRVSSRLKNLSHLAFSYESLNTSWELLRENGAPLTLKSLELFGSPELSFTNSFSNSFMSIIDPVLTIILGQLDEWIHLTSLERLSVDRLATLPPGFSKLKFLRSLQLNISRTGIKEAISAFLLQCNCLETLDLTGYPFSPSQSEHQLFLHLGKTLKSLRLHRFGELLSLLDKPKLDISGLDLLAKTCPKLQALGLDLDCELLTRRGADLRPVKKVPKVWVSASIFSLSASL